MITLTGTEKQIAWATDIRAAAQARMAEYDAALDRIVAEQPEAAEIATMVRARLHSETSAAWWIDHKALGSDYEGLLSKRVGRPRSEKAAAKDADRIMQAICEQTMYAIQRRAR